jgi:hypothetical protein
MPGNKAGNNIQEHPMNTTTAAESSTTPTAVSHHSRRSKATRRGLAVALGLALPLVGASAALAAPASTATTVKPNFRIALSSHTVAFGSENLGSSTTKTVKLTNTGAKAIHPEDVFSGSSEFALSANSCTGNVVKPGKTCTFSITFAPTAAGAVTGSLKVLTDEGTAAQKVAISGTGVQQLMESYHYLYTFTSPPVINGVATPQSFQGVGYAPAGTYTAGQTITVLDSATGLRQVGTYQIGNVNNAVPLVPAQLNTVAISTYFWGTNHYIVGTGLASGSGGSAGLGSEHGSLIGLGAEGGNVSFSDQQAAIQPIHF